MILQFRSFCFPTIADMLDDFSEGLEAVGEDLDNDIVIIEEEIRYDSFRIN